MPKTQQQEQQQQQQDSEIREDRDHISIKKHFTSATANWLSLLKGNEKNEIINYIMQHTQLVLDQAFCLYQQYNKLIS